MKKSLLSDMPRVKKAIDLVHLALENGGTEVQRATSHLGTAVRPSKRVDLDDDGSLSTFQTVCIVQATVVRVLLLLTYCCRLTRREARGLSE